MRQSLLSIAIAMLAMVIFTTGCQDGTDTPGTDTGDSHGHDHASEDDHAHDHPAHGPNGGHIFQLDDSEVTGEWCKFSDNNVIKMHILDAAGKEAMPMKVDSFSVQSMAGNDGAEFMLEADGADADGKASLFMLDDEDLATAIPLGVKIVIKSGDKTINGEIKAHTPLDH